MSADGRIICDMHSHILPRFDDGSGSSKESYEMLRALYAGGACRVVLTPHFYARQDEPEKFVSDRDASLKHFVLRMTEMKSESGDELPTVYAGAEVAFFNAMSICKELDEMCIRGTKYLLCEMPFERWTSAMTDELYALRDNRNVTPIIAHIDRYFPFFGNGMLEEMTEKGILIQANAEAFLSVWTRGRVLKLLEAGRIHLLGSDAHNMGARAPRLCEAAEVIEKKIGRQFIDKINRNSERVLSSAEAIFVGGETGA